MTKYSDLLETLNTVLGRNDLTLISNDEAHVVALDLPAAGVALPDLPGLVTALTSVKADQVNQLLSFENMGFTPTKGVKPRGATLSGLYLTEMSLATRDDGSDVSLGVQWYGRNWDVFPKFLTLSAPAASLTVSITAEESVSIGATIQGRITLLDAIDLDMFATRTWGKEKGEPVQITAFLPDDEEIALEPILDAFDLAGLPGISHLSVSELVIASTPSEHVLNVEFTMDAGWSPGWGEGAFELKDVHFVVAIEDGLTSAKITADTTIFGTDVVISAEETGFDWTFGLSAEPTGKSLGAVIDELGTSFGLGHIGNILGDFGHFGVSHVSAQVQLSSHRMGFSVRTSGEWEPSWCKGIVVSDLHFDLEHGGGATGQTSISASGHMKLGDHLPPLIVEAQFDGRDDGLTFTAKLDQGFKPKLSDFTFPGGLGFSKDIFPIETEKFDITKFEMSFNTKTREVHISFDGELTASVKMMCKFDISLTPSAGTTDKKPSYDKHFGGTITLGSDKDDPDSGMVFDLVFDASGDSKQFIAVYQNHAGKMTSLKPILASLMGPNKALDLRFAVREAILTASKLQKGDDFGHILALSIDAGADLSKLPMISKVLPADQSIGLGFKPHYASRVIEHEEVKALNALLPEGVQPFGGEAAQEVGQGFDMAMLLKLGNLEIDLSQPLNMIEHLGEGGPPKDDEPSFDVVPKDDPAPPPDPIKWFKVQKSFGPLSLSRIGLGFDLQKSEAKAVIDASISGGGLTLSAMGLGATYNISTKNLGFALDGLGLGYANGPTSISGAFLRLGKGEFVGEAMIRTATFGLSALGAYSDTDNFKSLFVYAFLDYPIGGPPFMFVEGAAAGFGYNRKVRDISVEHVRDFPFVKEAINPSSTPPQPPKNPADAMGELLEEMRNLDNWVHPSDGEHFLAIGMKFNSFRIIDSFALAIVSFGDRFRLDVLGTSTIVLPPAPPEATAEEKAKEPKLAVIDMSLKATFDPEESFLGVEASLGDTSWFLSKSCKLTGGFAFYSWYDGPHGGDFVTSLGGYYPKFKVPDHYPRPRRLELKWHVSEFVEIKGNAYFALTPNAMMAGGHYRATWQCGGLWASFAMGADFLMQWKPFHYEGRVEIEVSAGYGSLSGSIGAAVDIFGPEFSGTAHLKFLMVSFDIDFGASKTKAVAVDYQTFRSSFLPDDKSNIVTSSPSHGVIRTIPAAKQDSAPQAMAAARVTSSDPQPMAMASVAEPVAVGPVYVVNPKELQIATSSLVPATNLEWNSVSGGKLPLADISGLKNHFGVTPMNQPLVTSAKHCISIIYDGTPVERRFRLTGRAKPFAAAMWGAAGMKTDLAVSAVSDILGAAQITPLKPVVAGQTTAIPRRNVKFDPFLVVLDQQKKAPTTPAPLDLTATRSKQEIAIHLASAASHEKRKTMAQFLNVKLPAGTASVTAKLASNMTFAPRSGNLEAQS